MNSLNTSLFLIIIFFLVWSKTYNMLLWDYCGFFAGLNFFCLAKKTRKSEHIFKHLKFCMFLKQQFFCQKEDTF